MIASISYYSEGEWVSTSRSGPGPGPMVGSQQPGSPGWPQQGVGGNRNRFAMIRRSLRPSGIGWRRVLKKADGVPRLIYAIFPPGEFFPPPLGDGRVGALSGLGLDPFHYGVRGGAPLGASSAPSNRSCPASA